MRECNPTHGHKRWLFSDASSRVRTQRESGGGRGSRPTRRWRARYNWRRCTSPTSGEGSSETAQTTAALTVAGPEQRPGDWQGRRPSIGAPRRGAHQSAPLLCSLRQLRPRRNADGVFTTPPRSSEQVCTHFPSSSFNS